MKLTMDERVKQRMVGIAVILSIFAIFLPVIFKKSSQPFDGLSRIAVRMPAKPEISAIKAPDKQAMFARVKKADVEVKTLATTKQLNNPEPIALAKKEDSIKPVEIDIARAEKAINVPFKIAIDQQNTSYVTNNTKEKPAVVDTPKSTKFEEKKLPKVSIHAVNIQDNKIIISKKHKNDILMTKQSKTKNIINKPTLYSVQVASFAKLQNATAMVLRLKARGYDVHYKSTKHAQGKISYQIIVGQSKTLEEVHNLQQKLANQMQLNGFVVIG